MKPKEQTVRLIAACVVAASMGMCGACVSVASRDRRTDESRRERQEMRIELIDSLRSMTQKRTEFLLNLELEILRGYTNGGEIPPVDFREGE